MGYQHAKFKATPLPVWPLEVLNSESNPGIPNRDPDSNRDPGLFPDPEIPGLKRSNPGNFGIGEKRYSYIK